MSEQAQEEHPWNFERKPESDTTVLRFEVDGLKAKVEDILVKTSDVAATAMKAVKHVMGMTTPERGADDYEHDANYERGRRDGERSVPRNFGGVNGSSNGWTAWVLGIVGVLIAASVLGLTSAMFTMSQKVASLEAKVDIILASRK